MRRLVPSRLIRIYIVCHSVIDIYWNPYLQQWMCLNSEMEQFMSECCNMSESRKLNLFNTLLNAHAMMYSHSPVTKYTSTQKKVCTLYLLIFWKSKDGIVSCVVLIFSLILIITFLTRNIIMLLFWIALKLVLRQCAAGVKIIKKYTQKANNSRVRSRQVLTIYITKQRLACWME